MRDTHSTRLTPDERLRRNRDFQRVYAEGRRIVGRYFVVFVLERPEGLLRVGVVASRRVGGAVARNRAKRLLRETFRRNKPKRALSADLVLVARAPILEAGYEQVAAGYGRSMRQLFERLP